MSRTAEQSGPTPGARIAGGAPVTCSACVWSRPFVGKPLASLGAAAKNAIEVARLGGLDTGEQPSPYRVVARDPMYRLRHYELGDESGADRRTVDARRRCCWCRR